ncbi:MAG TPA: TlpA disulfide reductase family protein, partial [Pyrinomonadaceae bacterium]|nr:TlpA disulfide reductase family protein [Pyrinomonadaceae bacterium]
MKLLPILFSIVLLAVSGVAAQEKLKGECRIAGAPVPATAVGQKPLPECPPEPSSLDFPSVPDSVMKVSLVKRDGTVFTLDEFRGSVVVLHLFATWSGPDRADVPQLKEIQKQYKDSGLKVIGVDAGDGNGSPTDNKVIAQFAKKLEVNYDLVREVSFGGMSEAIYTLTKFNGV